MAGSLKERSFLVHWTTSSPPVSDTSIYAKMATCKVSQGHLRMWQWFSSEFTSQAMASHWQYARLLTCSVSHFISSQQNFSELPTWSYISRGGWSNEGMIGRYDKCPAGNDYWFLLVVQKWIKHIFTTNKYWSTVLWQIGSTAFPK